MDENIPPYVQQCCCSFSLPQNKDRAKRIDGDSSYFYIKVRDFIKNF